MALSINRAHLNRRDIAFDRGYYGAARISTTPTNCAAMGWARRWRNSLPWPAQQLRLGHRCAAIDQKSHYPEDRYPQHRKVHLKPFPSSDDQTATAVIGDAQCFLGGIGPCDWKRASKEQSRCEYQLAACDAAVPANRGW
jgi:hypothetical protein